MKLFDLLNIGASELDPALTKIHLAVWKTGGDDPLEVYLAGEFEDWQSWQTKKNFEYQYIVSLIKLRGNNRWLYADSFKSNGCMWIEKEKCYKYKTEVISSLNELSGRVIVSFKRSGRQSYLVAKRWTDQIFVDEMLLKKMAIEEFQGYNKCNISKARLDIIVEQNVESWRGALSNVSGIYLITDTKTGKQYVGSATGEEGIWQRWCNYSNNGHGGNKYLMAVLKEKGEDYVKNFQYTVIEIADTHASNKDILERESYWKEVLRTSDFGYN